MIKTIRRLYHRVLRRGQADPKLQHVYTGGDGTRYYTWVSPAEMPTQRWWALEQLKRLYELRLTREVAEALIAEAEAAANAGNITQVIGVLLEIKMRLGFTAERDSLAALATVFFLAEGEDPYVWTDSIKQAKLDAWTKHPEDLDFFLLAGWHSIESLPAASIDAIRSYLAEVDTALAGARQARAAHTKSTKASRATSTKSTSSTTP